MYPSLIDLGSLRRVIAAAAVDFESLRALSIDGFDGLYVLRKSSGLKLADWLKLNKLLSKVGYSAVFVAEPDRLSHLNQGLDLAQEFYLDFSAPDDVLHNFGHNFDQTGQQVPATALPFGQESLLREKLKVALDGLNLDSAGAQPPGYATVMHFLAGDNSVFSTEAFEQAALKLDQMESLQLVPTLAALRARHKVPSVADYQRAAEEVDVKAWLEVRKDPSIESEIVEPEFSEHVEALANPSIQAQQLIDRVEHLILVPVRSAELVPAFFHLGSVNDMPPAHIHLALIKRWEKIVHAKVNLLAFGPDTLSFHVSRPIADPQLALTLAVEQFRYCPDNVLQSFGTIRGLAQEINGCNLWQFWWE